MLGSGVYEKNVVERQMSLRDKWRWETNGVDRKMWQECDKNTRSWNFPDKYWKLRNPKHCRVKSFLRPSILALWVSYFFGRFCSGGDRFLTGFLQIKKSVILDKCNLRIRQKNAHELKFEWISRTMVKL